MAKLTEKSSGKATGSGDKTLPAVASISDVAKWLGRDRRSAGKLIADLEANYELKRKATGSRPFWLWSDFFAALEKMDLR